MNCLFCKIADKEIPGDIVYEDDSIIAFKDINPKAPIHLLIIPRKHIATINDLSTEDTELAGLLIQRGKQLAHDLGIADTGYRLIFNVNEAAGQEVFHIHLHLLSGTLLRRGLN